MSLLSVWLATTSYAYSSHWSARCLYLPPRCLSRCLSPVAWTTATQAVQHQWWTTSALTVSAECWSVLGHRHALMWPHNTVAAATALASSLWASHFQDGGAHSSVTSWSNTCVHCGRLLAAVRCWLVHTVVKLKWHPNVSRPMNAAECITSSVTGAFEPLVPDCGMTFHPGCSSQICPFQYSDSIWRHLTAVRSEFRRFNALYKSSVCVSK